MLHNFALERCGIQFQNVPVLSLLFKFVHRRDAGRVRAMPT